MSDAAIGRSGRMEGSPAAALGGREASIFTCLADAFLAPRPPMPAVRDTETLVSFEAWLCHSPRLYRIGLRLLLYVAELAPLLLGAGHRLRRLDPVRRRRWLARVERVRGRGAHDLVRAVKTLILLCYYGDPAVMAQLGYDADANASRGRELRRAEGRP